MLFPSWCKGVASGGFRREQGCEFGELDSFEEDVSGAMLFVLVFLFAVVLCAPLCSEGDNQDYSTDWDMDFTATHNMYLLQFAKVRFHS